MGPVAKHKREIQRDLKRQKDDIAKAMKIAEKMLLKIQTVENRMEHVENRVEDLPADVVDHALNAIKKRRDLSNVKSQLQLLVHRLLSTSKISTKSSLSQSFKPPRLEAGLVRLPGQKRAIYRVPGPHIASVKSSTSKRKTVTQPWPDLFGNPNSAAPRPNLVTPDPNLMPRPNVVAGQKPASQYPPAHVPKAEPGPSSSQDSLSPRNGGVSIWKNWNSFYSSYFS